MNQRKPTSRTSTTDLNHPVFKLAPQLFISSILLVIIATLFPFNFSLEDSFSFQELLDNFNNSTNLTDQISNVLLFMPLGFGLTCLLHKRGLGLTAKLAAAIFISFGLSLTVEVVQSFLPSRHPTPADIFNNTVGGFVGFLCFYLWKSTIFSYISALIKRTKGRLSGKTLTAIFIGYIALAFLIPIPWQSATTLSNWDLSFPLLVGNERTGDRPWQGYVSQVYIADRAISKEQVGRLFSDQDSSTVIGDSLLGSYQLMGQGNYQDQTGYLPDLSWQGQPPDAQNQIGAFLSSSHWLATDTSVTPINQRIRETSQFTLGATVATADPVQIGPARIVSLSSNIAERNFTLGQDGNDLVFRLRTPINGKNAAYFSQVVPGIFTDPNPHHIVVTYTGSVLQVYIDNLQNIYSFDVLELISKRERILYYGLMFIPLGALLALITTLAQGQSIFSVFLYSGILLPALIVEGILASGSNRSVSLENLLLGILITAVTLVVSKIQVPLEQRKGNTV